MLMIMLSRKYVIICKTHPQFLNHQVEMFLDRVKQYILWKKNRGLQTGKYCSFCSLSKRIKTGNFTSIIVFLAKVCCQRKEIALVNLLIKLWWKTATFVGYLNNAFQLQREAPNNAIVLLDLLDTLICRVCKN